MSNVLNFANPLEMNTKMTNNIDPQTELLELVLDKYESLKGDDTGERDKLLEEGAKIFDEPVHSIDILKVEDVLKAADRVSTELANLNEFYDVYMDFVFDLRKKLDLYSEGITFKRSESPSMEAYEWVGFNDLEAKEKLSSYANVF